MESRAEQLAVANLGTAVHLDVQLDLAQQFIVELQPLAGGISGGVVAQDAHRRAEVIRLQLRRHLAHRRGDHFAEHLQVPRGGLLAQPPNGRRHALDLIGIGLVLPREIGQITGAQGRLKPAHVDLRRLLLRRQRRQDLGIQVGRPPKLGEGQVSQRGVGL